MIYVCVPCHNEAATIGVLLWKIRRIFEEFPREYQLVVADDASTDATAEVLAPYANVLPLTVLGSPTRQGYARTVEKLLRHALEQTDRPKRDAVVLMHADFTHDAARAKQLLDEAGFRDPDGDGPQPRFRVSLKTSTSEIYRVQAAALQHDLARVGIAVDVKSSELQTLFADVLRGAFQLYTLQWVGVTDPDMLRRAFHSSQTPPNGFNRGYYVNRELDQVIDAATSAIDPGERLRLYKEAQRIVAADAPYISLWVMTNVAVAQAGITGVTLSPIADFGFMRDLQKRN